MKKLLLCAALASCFATSVAYAEEAKPAEPKPDNEVAFNVGVATEYRFRGVSQTRNDPSVQGGADYVNNPTGLYAGIWASSIKWIKDAGGGGNEMRAAVATSRLTYTAVSKAKSSRMCRMT